MEPGEIENHPKLTEPQLRRLLEVGRGLVAELDVEGVLQRVLETARELTGARYAALGILDHDKRELERFLVVGIDDETRRSIGPLPRGRGVLGELIREPRPLRLRDVRAHPRSYGFPPGHPPMTAFLGVPIAIRGEAYGNLYLTEKQGGTEFGELDEELVVVLAEWAAIAIDNARLYQALERRSAELERAVRGLEATATATRTLGFETDIERVVKLAAKRGRDLVNARALFILLEQRGVLRVAGWAGELEDGPRAAELPLAGTLAGGAVTSGKPERVARLGDRVGHGLDRIAGDATAALVAPLGFRGRARGVLVALDRLGESPVFDANDEHLLASFAASAAIAIATAQSVESDRRRQIIRASEAERKRWARELHDETLQELGALKLMLEARLGTQLSEPSSVDADPAVDQLQYTIQGLQNLITELRPAALDELGVEPAVEALVARTAATSGLEIECRVELSPGNGQATARLDPEIESTIYRLVQEALTNAVKHAGAERAWVEIIETGGKVVVSVSDDGRGFESSEVDGGFGLVGMRERAELVDGVLLVDSAHGRGTAVRVELPVRRPSRAAASGQVS
jgi:signal transduction histidine kinase